MSAALHVELPAEPGAAARSRRLTGRWLASLCGLDAPCDVGADLVLAVNEAVSNCIEHAYPGQSSGTVTLQADATHSGGPACAGLQVTVQVSDHGSWRAPPTDPGHRGRGLEMMRACADDVAVDRGPSGTTVTLHRALGRCPPGQAS